MWRWDASNSIMIWVMNNEIVRFGDMGLVLVFTWSESTGKDLDMQVQVKGIVRLSNKGMANKVRSVTRS